MPRTPKPRPHAARSKRAREWPAGSRKAFAVVRTLLPARLRMAGGEAGTRTRRIDQDSVETNAGIEGVLAGVSLTFRPPRRPNPTAVPNVAILRVSRSMQTRCFHRFGAGRRSVTSYFRVRCTRRAWPRPAAGRACRLPSPNSRTAATTRPASATTRRRAPPPSDNRRFRNLRRRIVRDAAPPSRRAISSLVERSKFEVTAAAGGVVHRRRRSALSAFPKNLAPLMDQPRRQRVRVPRIRRPLSKCSGCGGRTVRENSDATRR